MLLHVNISNIFFGNFTRVLSILHFLLQLLGPPPQACSPLHLFFLLLLLLLLLLDVLLKQPTGSNGCYPNVQGTGPSTGAWAAYQGQQAWRNGPSLPQQSVIANGFSARRRVVLSPIPSTLAHWLAWPYASLVQAPTVVTSVMALSCVEDAVPHIPPQLLSLKILQPSATSKMFLEP